MTFKDIVEELPLLSEAERQQLMSMLESYLKPKEHSILEFAGFAAELYDGVDAQDYVNQLRDEWDRNN